jgi:deoxyribodipyrimidine photo-lyase
MHENNKVIIWLKNDLRISDNPAFIYAIKNNLVPIPLFIWAPDEEKPWSPGSASRLWLHNSLSKLKDDLQNLGLDLILRQGPSQKAIEQIVSETQASLVVWNKRYEPVLLTRDKKIEVSLSKRISVKIFNGSLLFDPDQIKNQQGTPFKVFTPFYKHLLTLIDSQVIQNYPNQIKYFDKKLNLKFPELKSLNLDQLGILDSSKIWQKKWQAKMLAYAQCGYQSALELLNNFTKKSASEYKELRDRPDLIGTSRLASHLHFGEISPFQIWKTAQGHEAFTRQLIWREFAHYIMFHFPDSTVNNLKPEFDNFPWKSNKKFLEAWKRGQTGYPIVDAGMRELWETGWMHNRTRMIVGSFLIKDLLIHWQEGARWFWDTLFDANLANNSMGWQWVAGSGVDASPFFRIFNPMLQGAKFDPNGDYVRKWCPELSKLPSEWIHQPFNAPPLILQSAGVRLGEDYPYPLVNHESARQEALAGLQLTKKT